MNGRQGFTLAELIVAVVLFGIVGTAIYQVLVNNQRFYRTQSEQVNVNASTRAGVAVLASELRELSPTDPLGNDILTMTATSLTYRAMRNLYLLCDAPDEAGGTVTLHNRQDLRWGLRGIGVNDSILIFTENNPNSRQDDAWLRSSVTAMQLGSDCPGGEASIRLTLSGTAGGGLAGVTNGSPLRGFEVVQLVLDTDSEGSWLGLRVQDAGGGWGAADRVVGPLTGSGFQLVYLNQNGAVTATPAQVRRVAVTVTGQSSGRVRVGGGMDFLVDSLVTNVALRN